MSRAATKKVKTARPFTVAELVERFAPLVGHEPEVEAILDDMVDKGDFDVVELESGELGYLVRRERASRTFSERLVMINPKQETFDAPTLRKLEEQAFAIADALVAVGVGVARADGFRTVPLQTNREELERAIQELTFMRDRLRGADSLRTEGNREHLKWVEGNLRRLKIALRDLDEPAAEPVEVMCVSCGKRPRHFGDWCKRCCPPGERPTGKVA